MRMKLPALDWRLPLLCALALIALARHDPPAPRESEPPLTQALPWGPPVPRTLHSAAVTFRQRLTPSFQAGRKLLIGA